MRKMFITAIAFAALVMGVGAGIARADTAPVITTPQDGCTVRAEAAWPTSGQYVLGAFVDSDGYEVSYREIKGTRTLMLELQGYVGTTTRFYVEAYNQTTNRVEATKEVTVNCPASAVYTTEGHHFVGGREWRTTCEKYSVTTRCRTEILSARKWVFNNLTYLPSPRSAWISNLLGGKGVVGFSGEWSSDGRQWRTECDSLATGRGGCRAYILTWNGQEWIWLFNNIVLFS